MIHDPIFHIHLVTLLIEVANKSSIVGYLTVFLLIGDIWLSLS